MYSIQLENQFRKDYNLCKRRGYIIKELDAVIILLAESGNLPGDYKPHKLKGNYKRYWECHLKPDWLLIWEKDNKSHVIYLIRTGTHSDLFR